MPATQQLVDTFTKAFFKTIITYFKEDFDVHACSYFSVVGVIKKTRRTKEGRNKRDMLKRDIYF